MKYKGLETVCSRQRAKYLWNLYLRRRKSLNSQLGKIWENLQSEAHSPAASRGIIIERWKICQTVHQYCWRDHSSTLSAGVQKGYTPSAGVLGERFLHPQLVCWRVQFSTPLAGVLKGLSSTPSAGVQEGPVLSTFGRCAEGTSSLHLRPVSWRDQFSTPSPSLSTGVFALLPILGFYKFM